MISPNDMSQRKHSAHWTWGVLIGLIAVVILLFVSIYSTRLTPLLQGNGLALILLILGFLGTVYYFIFRLEKMQQESDV